MDEETREELRITDWKKVSKILLAVAITTARKYSALRRGDGGELALGKTCEDIVQDVLLKTWKGQRKWQPQRGPLLPWLKAVVKSEIRHLNDQKLRSGEFLIEQEGNGLEEQLERRDVTGAFGGQAPPNPERASIRREARENVSRELADVYALVEGDEDLEDLVLTVEYLINESESLSVPKRADIAAELNVPPSEITNRMKRLRRLLL